MNILARIKCDVIDCAENAVAQQCPGDFGRHFGGAVESLRKAHYDGGIHLSPSSKLKEIVGKGYVCLAHGDEIRAEWDSIPGRSEAIEAGR